MSYQPLSNGVQREQPTQTSSRWVHLPSSLFISCNAFLELSSVHSLALVCRDWADEVRKDAFWKRLYVQTFSSSNTPASGTAAPSSPRLSSLSGAPSSPSSSGPAVWRPRFRRRWQIRNRLIAGSYTRHSLSRPQALANSERVQCLHVDNRHIIATNESTVLVWNVTTLELERALHEESDVQQSPGDAADSKRSAAATATAPFPRLPVRALAVDASSDRLVTVSSARLGPLKVFAVFDYVRGVRVHRASIEFREFRLPTFFRYAVHRARAAICGGNSERAVLYLCDCTSGRLLFRVDPKLSGIGGVHLDSRRLIIASNTKPALKFYDVANDSDAFGQCIRSVEDEANCGLPRLLQLQHEGDSQRERLLTGGNSSNSYDYSIFVHQLRGQMQQAMRTRTVASVTASPSALSAALAVRPTQFHVYSSSVDPAPSDAAAVESKRGAAASATAAAANASASALGLNAVESTTALATTTAAPAASPQTATLSSSFPPGFDRLVLRSRGDRSALSAMHCDQNLLAAGCGANLHLWDVSPGTSIKLHSLAAFDSKQSKKKTPGLVSCVAVNAELGLVCCGLFGGEVLLFDFSGERDPKPAADATSKQQSKTTSCPRCVLM